ncbi:MAG: DHHA1 domain-containing protein [Sulfolobales archaeon]
MKTVILSHGDCDGVIAAALYIKHFLMDLYPSKVAVGFTQPWRASKEIKRLCKEDCEDLILLDIAVDKEIFSTLVDIVMRGVEVTVIDHHTTTSAWLNKLRELGVEIIWDKAPSTPRLIATKMNLTLNSYEQDLVEVADACEGTETKNPENKRLGDLIKLSISRDPSDLTFLGKLLESMLRGENIEDLEELKQKAKISRMLLDKLVNKIIREGESINNFILLYLQPAESRIYAGLFGIASTEAGKKTGRDIILIRDEDGKIVVTVRSFKGVALELCKRIVQKTSGGKFGGHSEAASATINGRSLREVVEIVKSILNEEHFSTKTWR